MNVYNLNDYFEFHFNLSRFDTGVATDDDGTPTWRCYEENNDTVVTNDNCAKRDDANTTGYYYARGQITSGAGFEVGKNYVVRATATVNSVTASAVIGTFKVVSATRGLAGTALPDAAADAAGGLPISDAGGLDLDAILADTAELQTDWVDGGRLDLLIDAIKAKTDALPSGIAKNVALAAFEFVMIDATDHISPIAGLAPTGTISKDGGAFGALANAVAEVSSGVYKIDLTQAEMNADVITLLFSAIGADDRIITILTS